MESKITGIEVDLFLEAVFRCYGYDFRHYARASIKRRIKHVVQKFEYARISDLTSDLLHKPELFYDIVFEFSVPVTEMFRDSSFYKSLREQVLPYLRTFPFLKIWHAGCATGEEVYSLAILLKEEDLYDRATIFATDFNEKALEKARAGIYSLKDIQTYTKNYQKAGGRDTFSNYYHARYKSAIMESSLSKNITFANHNLVTDAVFGEMNLILCRNVLIYFNRELQNKTLQLFDESLSNSGFLALGSKETIEFSPLIDSYRKIDASEQIYRKTLPAGLISNESK